MLFEYKAIKDNKIVKRRIESVSEADVIAFLKTNGYIPVSVHPASSFSLDSISIPFIGGIKFNDIVDFTRQLAIMLNAGLTVVDSLNILEKQTTNKYMTALIQDLDKKIKGGDSLSSALKNYPQYFSNLYVSLVKAGEASGKLSDIMLKLSENLEKSRELRGRLKGAFIYPIVVISVMIIVMFIMITFVIPKLLDLYKDFNAKLPLSTQILIFISNFSQRFWPFIIIFVVGGVFALRRYLKTRAGKYMMDSLSLRVPVFSKIIRMAALVDTTRTLAILIGSGVSILDSITIVTDTTSNVIYQQAFRNIYTKVEKGNSLGKSLSEEGIFPPILIQMTLVGESTGNLDDTLQRLARYFEAESDIAIKAATTLIEPAILIILGISVGFLVFSIITPIYSLTSAVQ